MGDVSLGAIKATLEVDASGVEKSVQQASAALARLGASSTQTAGYLAALMEVPEQHRGAFIGALLAEAEAVNKLGSTTKQASTELGKFASTVGGPLGSALQQAESGIRTISEGFSSTAVAAGVAVGAVVLIAGAVAGAAKAMFELGVAAAKYVETLDKMSLVTGISTNTLESLSKASAEAGVNVQSLVRFTTNLERAVANDSKAFAELGLSLADLKKSSPEELLRTVSEKLLSMTDIAERNAAATKLGGKAWMEALPGLQAYMEAGDRFINLTGDQKEALRGMDEALDKSKTAWEELKTQLGAVAASPEVISLIDDVGGAIRELARTIQDNREGISWFFGLLTMPFTIGPKTGEKIRSIAQTAGVMAAGFEEEGPAVKDIRKGKIFQPAQGLPALPNTHELERERQSNAAQDRTQKAAEAAAKKLQAEMDRLSGAKAQAEVDLVTKAFVGLQQSGQGAGVDLAALGKQMVDLAQKGAKIPDIMLPAIQAFAKEASMKDVPKLAAKAWDDMTKEAEKNISKQTALVLKGLKEQEDAEKQHWENVGLLASQQADALEDQYDLGMISTKQYYSEQKKVITDHYNELASIARTAAATEKDPALKAALLEQAALWDKIKDKALGAADAASRYAQIGKLAGDFGQILAGISDVFDAIGISADSAIGKIVSGLQTAAASVDDFSRQTTTAGKISSGLSAAAGIYKTGQQKGVAAGALSGAATGAAIGTMIAPGIGTVIGGAAGIIIGIAGGLRKPEYKKIMADVGKSWGVSISEGLGKEIAAIAKANNISRSLAELMSVSKIIGESGKDPREFTGKINDLMNAIKSGAVPAKEGLAELGKAFTMVADAAVAAGTVGDKAMVGLIKRARELGQVTPEMKAFVGAQLDSALAGIQKYVGAIEKLKDSATTTPEKFAAIGKTSGVVFGAMFDAMVSERGIVGAVDAMKDSYNTLHETLMSTLGPEAVSAILGPFGGAFATLQDETLRPIFEGIDGITQAMTGLANAGYLSTDQFAAMQDATAQLFDEAVAGGADMRTALLAVAPGIQAAISAAEQFGVPLDADMARLKGLAEQNGITFATDPQAAMLDVLVAIAQVLGADVPASARRAADSMRDLASSVPSNLDVNVNVNRNYRDNYSGGETFATGEPTPGEPTPYEGFQHGSGGVRDFGPGTNVTLHGKEAVVTEKQMTTMGAAPVSITMSPTFTGDPLLSNEGRKDLSQFQVEEFVRQVRNSPYIQQILRDRGLR